MSLSISEVAFRHITTLMFDNFGIHLPANKKKVVESRLGQMIVNLGYADYDAYVKSALSPPSKEELTRLANRLSTNYTYFHRQSVHYDFMTKTALPELQQRLERQGERDLRMWCAAASTGEEPYTLAMLMREHFGPAYSQWKGGLLATDISENALRQAKEGIYEEDNINPMPAELRNRYLKKRGDGRYDIVPAIKRDVALRRFNLMNKNFPFRKQFHVIFCRNVMIYFTREDVVKLVHRMYQATAPGGYFFIGLAESLDPKTCPYKQIGPAIYQKLG